MYEELGSAYWPCCLSEARVMKTFLFVKHSSLLQYSNNFFCTGPSRIHAIKQGKISERVCFHASLIFANKVRLLA
jgi:hypothetical protein